MGAGLGGVTFQIKPFPHVLQLQEFQIRMLAAAGDVYTLPRRPRLSEWNEGGRNYESPPGATVQVQI